MRTTSPCAWRITLAAKWHHVLTVIVIAAISGALISHQMEGRNRDLLSRSALVADVSAWLPFPAYSWTDANRITVLTSDRSSGFAMCAVGSTGRRVSLVPVRNSLMQAIFASQLAVWSPDGTELLLARTGVRPLYEVYSVGSGRAIRQRSRAQDVYSVAWLSGGHRFVAIENAGDHVVAVSRAALGSSSNAERTLPGPPFAVNLTSAIVGERVVTSSEPAGPDALQPDAVHLVVCVFWVSDPGRPARLISLTAPRRGDESYVVISRGGGRVVWVVTYTERRPAIAWWHGLPYVTTTPRKYKGIWVGDLDGSAMSWLGSTRIERHSDPPHDVQWCPGDRRVSYIARHRLWTISAD